VIILRRPPDLSLPDAAEARFHDGNRLTAHDVAFTLMLLKDQGHPIIQQQLRDLAGAEAPDDATWSCASRHARARRAAVRGAASDFLARLLHGPPVR